MAFVCLAEWEASESGMAGWLALSNERRLLGHPTTLKAASRELEVPLLCDTRAPLSSLALGFAHLHSLGQTDRQPDFQKDRNRTPASRA